MKLISHEPRVDDACRRTALLCSQIVIGPFEVAVRPANDCLPDDLGDAAYDPATNTILVDVDRFCSRAPVLQEAVLLHELGHALIEARRRGDPVAFGIAGNIIDRLSEELIADLFACISGRDAEIAAIQQRLGSEYVNCLQQWRDAAAFERCAQAYMAVEIARRMRR